MTLENYYYVYSAMTQATASLIALVGIFVVFRVQLQREKIDRSSHLLNILTFDGDVTGAYRLLKYIDAPPDEKKQIMDKEIEYHVKNFQKNKEILKYTREQGKIVIQELCILFIYYILVLHLNHAIYYSLVRSLILIMSCIFSVLILVRIGMYIQKCIQSKDE